MENTEASLENSKEAASEVNAERTRYMFTSRDQNKGQNHML
jgi:hypothetical protein